MIVLQIAYSLQSTVTDGRLGCFGDLGIECWLHLIEPRDSRGLSGRALICAPTVGCLSNVALAARYPLLA